MNQQTVQMCLIVQAKYRIITADQYIIFSNEGKINIDCRNKDGRTALMIASEYDVLDFVNSLLTCGADANLQDSGGLTALIYASKSGNIDIVRTLLNTNGIDVNIENNYGHNAEMAARINGHYGIVELFEK